jgi:uncharacterized protein YggT (Ycf19 family)
MADEIREVRDTEVVDGNDVVRRQAVTTRSADQSVVRGQSLVYTLFGLLEALLAIRIVLSLLGANTANAFASFIYGITAPFVIPFQGLFGYKLVAGVSRFEIETLVAMVVYAIVSWFIVKLMELGKKRPAV